MGQAQFRLGTGVAPLLRQAGAGAQRLADGVLVALPQGVLQRARRVAGREVTPGQGGAVGGVAAVGGRRVGLPERPGQPPAEFVAALRVGAEPDRQFQAAGGEREVAVLGGLGGRGPQDADRPLVAGPGGEQVAGDGDRVGAPVLECGGRAGVQPGRLRVGQGGADGGVQRGVAQARALGDAGGGEGAERPADGGGGQPGHLGEERGGRRRVQDGQSLGGGEQGAVPAGQAAQCGLGVGRAGVREPVGRRGQPRAEGAVVLGEGVDEERVAAVARWTAARARGRTRGWWPRRGRR
ncbi:hypothetical protein ACFQVA_40625 [Actinomadura keratinilytica]